MVASVECGILFVPAIANAFLLAVTGMLVSLRLAASALRDDGGRRRRLLLGVLSAGSFFLALLAKEALVASPLLLLALAVGHRRRPAIVPPRSLLPAAVFARAAGLVATVAVLLGLRTVGLRGAAAAGAACLGFLLPVLWTPIVPGAAFGGRFVYAAALPVAVLFGAGIDSAWNAIREAGSAAGGGTLRWAGASLLSSFVLRPWDVALRSLPSALLERRLRSRALGHGPGRTARYAVELDLQIRRRPEDR